MSQIVLPLRREPENGPARIVVGSANAHLFDAMAAPESWPFLTAILTGLPRSGKSLIARWFAEQGKGESLDNADQMDETALFHLWNRTQEAGKPLLLIAGDSGWEITLPDLKSRLGAALHLETGPMDDEMAGNLILALAEQYGLALGEGAAAYLVPRCERSFAGIEKLVQAIDRISLERKVAATQSIWRDALSSILGAEEPRLL